MEKTKNPLLSKILVRVIAGSVVILAGLGSMAYFKSLKKAPARGAAKEMQLKVLVEKAVPVDVMTRLNGFGVAAPVTTVKLSSEVAGRILYTHPNMKKGGTIEKGEVVFKVDPVDYQTEYKRLASGLAQKEAVLSRIKKEFEADKKREKTLGRSKYLARAEYERVKTLLEESSIGNRSEVGRAEQAMNTAVDTHDKLMRSLALYPALIREAQAGIESMEAQKGKAEAKLVRCTVRAPFNARVKNVYSDLGEYVSPGRDVAVLADDAFLEIVVSLDAREVGDWMEFDRTVQKQNNWFPDPVQVPCEIAWIESKGLVYQGRLSRLVEFDPSSRTVGAAVLLDGSQNQCSSCPPLVEGMFCRVSIPGKTIKGVYKLKRWLVTTDNTIYVAAPEDGGFRLKTVPVERIYTEGDELFLSGQIFPGDLLITTRLVDPLENAAVKIIGGMESIGPKSGVE